MKKPKGILKVDSWYNNKEVWFHEYHLDLSQILRILVANYSNFSSRQFKLNPDLNYNKGYYSHRKNNWKKI